MKKILLIVFGLIFILTSQATAQNKVVVIPLMEKNITCSGTLSAGGRWCDNGDATVIDMATGLVWLKYASWGGLKPWRSNTPDDYDDAHRRAGILHDGVEVYSGSIFGIALKDGSVIGDWRLPTKTEIVNLSKGTEGVSSAYMHFFVEVTTGYYWSSSTYEGRPDWAWAGLFNPPTGAAPYDKTFGYYVWPVRGPE